MQNIRKNIESAFVAANRAYIARQGEKAQIDEKSGFQSDIYKGMKCALGFTDAQLARASELGIDWEQVGRFIAQSSNVKKAARIPQFIGFVVTSGDVTFLQGSAHTALIGFCALMIGAKNKNGLMFTATGKGSEMTSDSVNVSKGRAVQKMLGVIDIGSLSTQASVTFSKGGILPALGCCDAWEGKGELAQLPTLKETAFNNALIKMIETASNNTIAHWVTKGKN